MDKKPRISMIAAVGKTTRVLGRDNDLVWRISDDLKRFKSLTMGHPIIMGRKTYESIGRALPGRLNIVITRNKRYEAQGAKIVGSLDKAIDVASKNDPEEIFIIGGAQIYEQAIGITSRLYLTLVDSDEKGDADFPDYSIFEKEISREVREADGLTYEWVTLEK